MHSIGPVGLTVDTLSPASSTLIPTVTDNLFSKQILSLDGVAISFEPATVEPEVNGEITWGKLLISRIINAGTSFR